jgi:hypothetical protein
MYSHRDGPVTAGGMMVASSLGGAVMSIVWPVLIPGCLAWEIAELKRLRAKRESENRYLASIYTTPCTVHGHGVAQCTVPCTSVNAREPVRNQAPQEMQNIGANLFSGNDDF